MFLPDLCLPECACRLKGVRLDFLGMDFLHDLLRNARSNGGSKVIGARAVSRSVRRVCGRWRGVPTARGDREKRSRTEPMSAIFRIRPSLAELLLQQAVTVIGVCTVYLYGTL